MNNRIKQKAVVGRIRELKINLVCLLETRVNEHNMKTIINGHFQGWQMFHNYSEKARNGRIWFLWNDLIQVGLVGLMDQSITCVSQRAKKFYLSAVYGSNEGVDRRRLWSHLLSVKGSLSQFPWMLVGDFNVITHPSESSNFISS